jgi:hypothetical protein
MSLDDDLAAWAAAISLTPAAAEAIYQRIVAGPAPARVPIRRVPTPLPRMPVPRMPPPGLEPEWWRRFSAGFTSRMIISTRPAQWAA